MPLSVNVNVMTDGVAVVSVRGEIDHGNANELLSELQGLVTGRRPVAVRVDLGLVTFLDSAGIGALVAAHRATTAEGARLTVHPASPFVARQLRIAGVAELLSVSPVEPIGGHGTGLSSRAGWPDA